MRRRAFSYKDIVIVCAAMALLLGVPFLSSGRGRAMLRGESPDAVSSASIIIDAPSGDYIVLINTDSHPDSEKLALWEGFFSGEDIGIIFEDIDCQVIRGDAGGLDMAMSLRSRLPENQMSLSVTDGTLLMSKAAWRRFDIILMSAEYAALYSADGVYDIDGIRVLSIEGEEQSGRSYTIDTVIAENSP